MPHGFLKDFKSNLNVFAAILLARAQVLALQHAQKVILEILERLKEECPPPEVLESLLNKINAVKQVINGIEGIANKIRPLPQYLQPAIIGAKIIVDIIAHFEIPTTIGTPPGPAGGVIFSETKAMSSNRSSKLVKFQKFIETLEDDVAAINLLLTQFQGIFAPILASLSLVEGLLSHCITNQSISDEDRRRLLGEIQGAATLAETEGVLYTSRNINNLPYPNTTENEKFRPGFAKTLEGSIVSTSFGSSTSIGSEIPRSGISTAFGLENPQPGNFQYQQIDFNAGNILEGGPVSVKNLLTEKRASGNTYLIKLIDDPTAPPIAPRRQAIAQDYRGVTVLRGPVSFASRPEILIEEMKFLIDNRLP